jgi:hypothetical protein
MKRQPNFTPRAKISARPRPPGFSVVRLLALLLALGSLAFGAAWLAHRLSPTARLSRRTAALAASVMVQRQALPPLEIARRLAATESALAPDASAEFMWQNGDTWTVEGRRELKDLHARLLAEAPRLWLFLEGIFTTARRPAPGAVDISVHTHLRLNGETTLHAALLATLHWRKTPDGWKIHRAEFLLDDLPPDAP